MDELHENAYGLYLNAVQEYKRIECMVKEVCWYNFETVARKWQHPWPESLMESKVKLEGVRYETITRRGRERETSSYHTYYDGPLHSAPSLPPEIMLRELRLAHELVLELKDACWAPYDWAPGGDEYIKMMRTSNSVRLYDELSSKVRVRDARRSREDECTRSRRECSDKLGGSTSALPTPPSQDILG